MPLFSDFDPQLAPNGGREGGNDVTKYFGYKYLVNRSEIIEVYEKPLGHFYCLLHTVCVNEYEWEFIKIQFCVVDVSLLKCHARKIKRRHVSYLFRTNRTDNQVWLFHDFLTVRLHFLYCSFQKKNLSAFLKICWFYELSTT